MDTPGSFVGYSERYTEPDSIRSRVFINYLSDN
jgi:hypothetical protein